MVRGACPERQNHEIPQAHGVIGVHGVGELLFATEIAVERRFGDPQLLCHQVEAGLREVSTPPGAKGGVGDALSTKVRFYRLNGLLLSFIRLLERSVTVCLVTTDRAVTEVSHSACKNQDPVALSNSYLTQTE